MGVLIRRVDPKRIAPNGYGAVRGSGEDMRAALQVYEAERAQNKEQEEEPQGDSESIPLLTFPEFDYIGDGAARIGYNLSPAEVAADNAEAGRTVVPVCEEPDSAKHGSFVGRFEARLRYMTEFAKQLPATVQAQTPEALRKHPLFANPDLLRLLCEYL